MGSDNIYCAFLRGANVNGRNMKMTEVCEVFEQTGMSCVSSVLATGNIIFKSGKPNSILVNELESSLSDYYSYEVKLFLKDIENITGLFSHVPFIPNSGLHIYAFIHEPGFEVVLMDEYKKITPQPGEQGIIDHNLFYWQVETGATLNSEFSKILGCKDLKEKFTSRNINTISKIYNKMMVFEEKP